MGRGAYDLSAMSTEAPDPLERFVLAQEHEYPRALAELQAERKTTHWIWYVLPQLRGLGQRPGTAIRPCGPGGG